jgi:23S rRNA pseudouridine1911/1915/1917 synthase
MKQVYTVPEDHDGQKLSSFIRGRGMSSALWKRVKWHGKVMINGVPCHNAKTILHAGDQIVCEWEEISTIVPSDIPLPIIYEDEWLLVVNKGPHMIIHPTSKEHFDTLVNAVAGYFKKTGQSAGIHPVYRLDRNTTGLVVVAKSAKTQHDLSKTHDCIYREYLALAKGQMEKPEGTIDAPIGRKDGSIIEWTVRDDGKQALTDYWVVKQGQDYSLLKFHLHTGRTHQIRVHMQYMKHPLLGDDLYGEKDERIDRQALHASLVRFIHPETGQEMEFTAPLPEDMKTLVDAMD